MTTRTVLPVTLTDTATLPRVVIVNNHFLDPQIKKATDPLVPYTFTPGEGFNFSTTIVDVAGPDVESPRFLRYTRTDNTAGVVQPAGHSPSLLISTASNKFDSFGLHRLDIYVRSNHTVAWTLEVRYYDAGGLQVGLTETVNHPVVDAGVWRRLDKSLNVEAGVVSIDIRVRTSETQVWAVGDTFEVGGAMIVQGSAVKPYGDGDTYGWRWSGAKYASSSYGFYIVTPA